MRKVFLDTETIGLHGVIVKLQWQFEDDPAVSMIDVWLEKVSRSIELIEEFVRSHVIAHNLRFDWFHLSKWYNMCLWVLEHHGDVRPIDVPIDDMVEAEWQSQFGLCLKPAGASCTLLHSQQGELQTLMNRKAITVKRQPIELRELMLAELEKLTAHLPPILFARRADPHAPRWSWSVIKDEDTGIVVPDFVDLKLVFKPSNALKAICEFKLGYKPKFKSASVVDVPKEKAVPEEFASLGYMPFARLAGYEMWPNYVETYVDHWANNKDANQYAHDDIPLLRMLYEHLGSPEADHYGSMACQIASTRLHGFEVNIEKVKENLADQKILEALAPINVGSPLQVRKYIAEAMDDIEALAVARSANKEILEGLIQEYVCDEEEECCDTGCARCDTDHAALIFGYDLEDLKLSKPKKAEDILDWENLIERTEDHITRLKEAPPGIIPEGRMPVIARAREILRTREATKRIQVYDKLIQCQGRMYPSFNPIGAKSGRLSGAEKFNYQAIGKEELMRSVFKMHDGKNVLSMGDYDSLEIVLAVIVYGDDDLMRDVSSGKSLHALMASELYDMTYDQVMSTKGTKNDLYGNGKTVVYALLYGSTIAGIAYKLTLPANVVQKAYDNFVKKYPGVAEARKRLSKMFTAISQPGGRGTEVYYKKPQTSIESMFGFTRDFSIEFDLVKILFDFANDIPNEWKKIPGKSVRYGEDAKEYWRHASSGLFGAATNSIQSGVIRAALNHIIQSTGNHLTVGLQCAVWGIQPVGIHPFKLNLMSVHDELCVVSDENLVDTVRDVVYTCIEEQRVKVPLLSMGWLSNADSWAGKTTKSGTKTHMGFEVEHAT